MRVRMLCLLVLVLFVLGLFAVTGCGKKPEEPTPPPKPATATEKPAEPGEESGEAVMAKYEDATEPPVDWTWDHEKPIDPASIPDEPAAGIIEGKLFVVKHALLQKDPKDEDDPEDVDSWDLRFYDAEPEPGDEASMFGISERHMEVTIPKAAKGVKVDVPFDSDEWDISDHWFWYQTPRVDSPDGISVNPGSSSAMYVEITDWDETPSPDNEDIIGTAKGKVAIGSHNSSGDEAWLAGNFEATIVKPW